MEFWISEIPVCKLPQQNKGFWTGEPGNRNKTHSLFMDDLKQYQGSHKVRYGKNKFIVQASHDTGACYGVTECAEIVFEHGKMMSEEGLPVLDEPIETMDPDKNEIYKLLGEEQADGIKTKVVFECVRSEVVKRVKMLDAGPVSAINVNFIPVAAYSINVSKFSQGELHKLDQIV